MIAFKVKMTSKREKSVKKRLFINLFLWAAVYGSSDSSVAASCWRSQTDMTLTESRCRRGWRGSSCRSSSGWYVSTSTALHRDWPTEHATVQKLHPAKNHQQIKSRFQIWQIPVVESVLIIYFDAVLWQQSIMFIYF